MNEINKEIKEYKEAEFTILSRTRSLNRNLILELDEDYFRLLSEKRMRTANISGDLLRKLQEFFIVNSQDLQNLGDLIETK